MAVFNLFPDFTSFLVPAVKPGSLALRKFQITNGVTPGDGSTIEFNAVRPNSPEDALSSSAHVYDSSGNIVELAENVPAWSYPPGGSPAGYQHLQIRGQVKNLVSTNSGLSYNTGAHTFHANKVVNNETFKDITLQTNGSQIGAYFSLPFGEKIVVQQAIKITSGGSPLQFGFMIDRVEDNTPYSQVRINADGTLALNNLNDYLLDYGVLQLSDGYALAYLLLDDLQNTANGGIRFGYTMQGNRVDFGLVGVYLGTGFSGVLAGAGKTRNAFSFSSQDLVDKNVFGSQGWSMYLSLTNYYFGNDSTQDLMTFKTENNIGVFSLRAVSGGLTIYDHVNEQFINSGLSAKQLVITFDRKNLKLFSNGQKLLEVQYNLNYDITQLDLVSRSGIFDITAMAFSELVLAEEVAINHVSE